VTITEKQKVFMIISQNLEAGEQFDWFFRGL